MPSHIIDFRTAETTPEIANFLGLDPKLLRIAIRASDNPAASFYIRHCIPKKSGAPREYRTVWDVDFSQIRDAHRRFAWRFGDFAAQVVPGFPHTSSYGYVRGRGIKDNAEKHTGARKIIRCDLKEFFATITRARLVSRFVQIDLHRAAAEVLASFATIEGTLALGLNASPMLANLVCQDLDQKLAQLAADRNCVYTRYADDIAISGDLPPAAAMVSDIVEAEGFHLSPRKTRISKLGRAHYVTGLSVSDPNAPHVPRPFKKRLRQELYYCQKFGIRGHLDRLDSDGSHQRGINRLDGSVRFLASIEPALGIRMRTMWRDLLIRDSVRVSYSPVHDKFGLDATFLVDETLFEKDDKKYLALACVTTEQIGKLRSVTEGCLRKYLIDPFTPGRKEKLKRKKLHFSDAPESLRSTYIGLLPYLPFRTYLAFRELGGESYSVAYGELLSELLPRRFKEFDRGHVTVVLERNPQVPLSDIANLVATVYGKLEAANERRPLTLPQYAVSNKADDPALSIPDCMLWVFARAFSVPTRTEGDILHFERLRDKYRHIVDKNSGLIYSRRHPIEMRLRSHDE